MNQLLDVRKIVDEAKFNSFHGVVLAWCALIIVFDGYDLVVVGVALPSIMQEMGVTGTQAGFMASSALFGMTFGAIFLGTLADRIGRRRVIAICIMLFSVFTAAAGLATDPIIFGVLRFIAGIGIGGAMPTAVAEMSEYAPRRMRSTLVALMFSGYSIGAILAALLGKAMIPSYGWQSVFYIALIPVVLIPFILRSLPESMHFLLRVGRLDELKAIVARIDPSYQPLSTVRCALPAEDRSGKAPVRLLFSEGRGFSTMMLWLAFFMCLFIIYAMSTWLAKLMVTAGHSLGSAMDFVLVLNFGGILGAVGCGLLADRFSSAKQVLIGMYLVAAVSISLLGQPMPMLLLLLVAGLAGASTIGTQIVTNAYVAQFYPPAISSTGLGWALGIGRVGAILAPIMIGVLVAIDLPLEMNFMTIALPALLGALGIALVNNKESSSYKYHQDVSANLPHIPPEAFRQKS